MGLFSKVVDFGTDILSGGLVGAVSNILGGPASRPIIVSPPGRQVAAPTVATSPVASSVPVPTPTVSPVQFAGRTTLSPGFRGGVQPAGFGAASSYAPVVGQVIRQGAGVAAGFGLGEMLFGGGNGDKISDILRKARENTGRSVTSKKIRDSARHCGLELTAQMYGLDPMEVCRIVTETRSRRARGISASDLRRTRSTLRKVHGIQKQFKAAAAGRRC